MASTHKDSSSNAIRVRSNSHGELAEPSHHTNSPHVLAGENPDLYSILSSMHLANNMAGTLGNTVGGLTSRKRKILDGGHGSSGGGNSGKMNGTRPPALRRNSREDDEAPLQTPQCSQSGFADDEDRQHHDEAHSRPIARLTGFVAADNHHGHLITDIVDDNLAADFDGSLSGLGVDMHNTSTFSMNEALNALPNLSISSTGHIFKQEALSPTAMMKSRASVKPEPATARNSPLAGEAESGQGYGALDLSNDEAHLPEESNGDSAQVTSFTGSVSRESTPYKPPPPPPPPPSCSAGPAEGKSKRVILQQNNSAGGSSEDPGGNFQYILAASTSTATKINEPSITYLNQGQSYELRLKKLGDLSPYRKKMLRCVLRICFHERRLQYMEAEQIVEWSAKHPGERIIDVDLPLSYGVVDPVRDAKTLNALAFQWDPTRDTGIYIKVNCISTEFTPKKHGGEKGVPFRLQVETLDADSSRLHAAGCVLQVFKLKGADRKHKQDREKINKRPAAEQEKFSPSYECTVLTDLPMDQIYVPSRSGTPISTSAAESPIHTEAVAAPKPRLIATSADASLPAPRELETTSHNALLLDGIGLDATASVGHVTAWLFANRYGSYLSVFRNFNGRDLLRLSREDVVTFCGPPDGVRLYNDLHSVPVSPKKTFFVAGDGEYSPIFLEQATVGELVRKLSDAFGLAAVMLDRVFFVGPQEILVNMTDAAVLHARNEAVYRFSLRSSPVHTADGVYDVVLEEVKSKQIVSNAEPSKS